MWSCRERVSPSKQCIRDTRNGNVVELRVRVISPGFAGYTGLPCVPRGVIGLPCESVTQARPRSGAVRRRHGRTGRSGGFSL